MSIVLAALGSSPSAAQPRPPGPPGQSTQEANAYTGPIPFGANLFMGNFLKQREDGLNPDYVVMPGDRVAVYTWGTIEVNQVFVVDSQGNIFLPEVGPVPLAGVRNAELTATVERAFHRVYTRNFGVYTNLLTAAPVAVYVTGGVQRPGRYAGVPSDSVLFFLDQAGGIDPSLGSYRDIVVMRQGAPLADVDLYDFLLDGTLPELQFADGDTILVRGRGPVVEVKGDVATPALVELDKERFDGGDVLHIIPAAARATEVTVIGLRAGRPFSETMSVATLRTTALRNGDVLEVRDDGVAETILVHLEGEFKAATLLSVLRGTRLVDLLNHIEVDPDLADLGSIHIRRPAVAKAQKKSIDDSLFRLERSALLALSDTNVEADIRLKEAELLKTFLERARLVQPLGRIVTNRDGTLYNLRLEDGDVIVIPRRTNVIRVGGEVHMSQALVYDPDLRVEDYISRAGGYSDRADRGRIILLHADASVSMTDDDARVRPGDEILIPPRVDSKIIQNTMDITSVIYQIAVAAAVVLAI
ncbi:polysaccharide biosynthesis/export family protein [Haliangium sp.]|uniref:polysaccharide biosynthesis/export family protein n=1 Tax=Haliangium sp. TaxID=2663208 RepID=UPI003D111381